jgi:predicted RecB family nuclease
MRITDVTFAASLNCPTKCFLYLHHEAGDNSEFSQWQARIQADFEAAALDRMRSDLPAEDIFLGTPLLSDLRSRRYRLVIGYEAVTPEIQSRLHALQLVEGKSGKREGYVPIRLVSREKLNASDRLCLAFDALAVSHDLTQVPRVGRLVHGRDHRTVTVHLDPWIKKARRSLSVIRKYESPSTPPPLILNRHCGECEFQERCRQLAVDHDDLSLLANLSEKEWKKQHAKGIFTVTQLSFTFRPRRRVTSLPGHHQHALKALAIRTNKIHVLGSVTPDSTPATPVYIDVEGDPDRDFYYLIGLRLSCDGSPIQYSFWADDPAFEKKIWTDCLRILRSIDNPTLVHYGSYETSFFKRMRDRYSDCVPALVENIIAKAINLVSTIYAHVYFPTYSNRLKEIGDYVGSRWSAVEASGLSTLIWRSRFEQSQDAALKQKLITYNAEDCQALQMVAETVWRVLDPKTQTAQNGIVDVSTLKREYPQHFGVVDFLLPEFKAINEAAYWDYQRSRVYIRTDGGLSKLYRRKDATKNQVRPNKVVHVEDPRPDRCRHCEATLIHKWGTLSQTVYDLRFTNTGIKRWVVRFVFQRFICWQCKRPFQLYTQKPKYGTALFAYVLYQLFEMDVSQNAIAASLSRLFGLPFSRGGVNHLKETAAGKYRAAYDDILRRIVSGKLIHADETKAKVKGRDGYVWVFTSLEEVAFVYRGTREAEFVHEMLKPFKGVLVSDYFSGYDSIPCVQQKCLIHLMRDINEDLRKHPFSQEMRQIAEAFACLLRPMIATVDRFGLKARHLRKHRPAVEKFFCALEKRDYQTEVAVAYRKRFEKNRNKLFTFLDCDGVPWNNNNAEHAIKAFARLRRSMGGTSTVKGMEDYLVLLSISETCKAKGADTLDLFLADDAGSFAAHT